MPTMLEERQAYLEALKKFEAAAFDLTEKWIALEFMGDDVLSVKDINYPFAESLNEVARKILNCRERVQEIFDEKD